ncbi:MAG: hypothetical protein HC902_09110 [Calothrix sp. SM1_5_4]|nr:hypothetical protein [Calothrix sp. SM1_5_4]
MEAINELELRRLLKNRPSAHELSSSLIKIILNPSLPWSEKRSAWHLLYLTGRESTLAQALTQCLKGKFRVPLDLFIQICADRKLKPTPIVTAALIKGLRKQSSQEEVFAVRAWDRNDDRLRKMRMELLERKVTEQKKYREDLLEKFNFLQSQRMHEQAARVLRRMLELYPDDREFLKLKAEFDENLGPRSDRRPYVIAKKR